MSHEVITTDEHLRLTQLQPEQADRLFELTDQNREYLGEFLPWPKYVQSVDDSRKHIEETIQKRIENTSYTYGVEADGIIVGNISIRNLNEIRKTPEIGYWMSPDYTGKGLMTKAVQALTSFGFQSLGLKQIIIRADPMNIGSNRVAEKAGYTQVGVDTEDGRVLNVWYYKTMPETIFDKIVRKEIDSYIVWESDSHIAFLTPFPNTPGFTVVIPKVNVGDNIFGLTDEQYVDLMKATKSVANLLEKALDVKRVALVFEGTGVAHVHAKLIPLYGTLTAKGDTTDFTEEYQGYITTLEGPKMDDARLDEIRDRIVAAQTSEL